MAERLSARRDLSGLLAGLSQHTRATCSLALLVVSLFLPPVTAKNHSTNASRLTPGSAYFITTGGTDSMKDNLSGSESWWQEKRRGGIPEITAPENGQCQVTFWWRDPQGDERQSAIKRVWIYLTGITDHHQPAVPCSLQRLSGTDAWYWQTQLDAGWRGSYCLIPSTCETDFSAAAFRLPPDQAALRAGWSQLLPQAIADPFNPQSWRGNRGHPMCALHLPQAAPQPGWDQPAATFTAPHCIDWHSQRLNNRRRVWLFRSGRAEDHTRPLAILLDGQFWAQSMPVWPAIEALTLSGSLPPALYLLIDVIDNRQRARELTCNPDFWLALQAELLPVVRPWQGDSDNLPPVLVAGQSFGGLAALYAGLRWPQVFHQVLSQSGSFWWPDRQAGQVSAHITGLLADKQQSPRPLHIYLEAGLREPVIHQAHRQLLPLLRQTPHRVLYHETSGGHDALCWRGGLLSGLSALWQDQQP